MKRASLLWVLAAIACGGTVDDVQPAGAGGSGNSGGAGSGNGGNGAGTTDDGLPCDVSDLLEARCQSCHADPPQFGAPMALVTRSQLMATPLDGSGTVAEEAVARMQSDDRMPPPPNDPASRAEVAVLQNWIDAGYPAGDGNCGQGGSGAGGGGYTLDCEPDTSIKPAQPFEMPASSSDEQVCFGIEIAASADKRHIIAIAPTIDNTTIVHHMLLLEAPNAVGAGPTDCPFASNDWKLLYGWGPGTPPHVLPEAAGFPLDANEPKHLVLQIHYNNLQGLSGETDQSGVELCTTTELRPNDADIMAFGGTNFDIPPQSTATLDCSSPIPSLLEAYFPITVFQSWPHMHVLGEAQQVAIDHGGGGSSMLVDVQDYDFNYQIAYPATETVDVGDTVRTSCTWTNTTSQSVGFGENTGDEMCFNFFAYYPRITAPAWSWLLPAETASCDMQ